MKKMPAITMIRPSVCRAAAVLVGALAFATGLRAEAPRSLIADSPVIILQPSVDAGRADLRRALINADDSVERGAERRQLSREERDALNQELRRAVSEAYQKRARTAK